MASRSQGSQRQIQFERHQSRSRKKSGKHVLNLDRKPPPPSMVDAVFYKNLLQEVLSKAGLPLPVYETQTLGKIHPPAFISTVEVNGERFTGKEAKKKKIAETSAAKVAYHNLKDRQYPHLGLIAGLASESSMVSTPRMSRADMGESDFLEFQPVSYNSDYSPIYDQSDSRITPKSHERNVKMRLDTRGSGTINAWASGGRSKLSAEPHYSSQIQGSVMPLEMRRTTMNQRCWVENYTEPCLTMHQPWASLLVHGIKRIEGRSWPSPIQGRLWIHAASTVPSEETIKAMENFYIQIYAIDGVTDLKFPDQYPVSKLLGCVDIVGCLNRKELESWEMVPKGVRLEAQAKFCWLCEQPQKLLIPFSMRGYRRVYNLEKKVYDSAIRRLTPVKCPVVVKFPILDQRDRCSLKPSSVVVHFPRPEGHTSLNLDAAIAGARVAGKQFSAGLRRAC